MTHSIKLEVGASHRIPLVAIPAGSRLDGISVDGGDNGNATAVIAEGIMTVTGVTVGVTNFVVSFGAHAKVVSVEVSTATGKKRVVRKRAE